MCSAVPQVRSPQYPQSAVRAAQYAAKDPAVLRRTAYTARSAADFVQRTAAQHCTVYGFDAGVLVSSAFVTEIRHSRAVQPRKSGI